MATPRKPSSKDESRLVRLNALLSQRGVASRREAERMMAEGRVLVDGRPAAEPGTKVDPNAALIEVDGRPLPNAKADVYIALHKPEGYLSSFRKDKERGRVLTPLLSSSRKLTVAGRLDRDSSGLLLISSDGDWVNRVMHPRYEKEKEYLVRLKGARPTPGAKRLQEATFREAGREFGAHLVEPVGSYVRMVLREGRKHQVRRLVQAAGLEVRELIRVRIGTVELGTLKPGKHRPLTREEIRSFFRE